MNNSMTVFAHTREDARKRALPEGEWQTLDEHLTNVARLARDFAEEFGAGEMGFAAGLLHDIGKATEAFQARLRGRGERVDHKTEGGRIASLRYKPWGRLLAYVICGHHSSLPDYSMLDGHDGLDDMLSRQGAVLLSETPDTPASVSPHNISSSKDKLHKAFYIFMLVHMLHSALVDADYLDTERFMSPQTFGARGGFPPLAEYVRLFEPKLAELLGYKITSTVFQARRDVLNACLAAAELDHGLFKLTVPTGIST